MRVEVIANIASGSLGRTAPAQAEAILAEHCLEGTVHPPAEGQLNVCLRAAIDSAPDIFRLGVSTVTGNWRNDPSVIVGRCRVGKVWADGRIPAILDGEPVRMDDSVSIRFRPKAFRALVPDASSLAQ